jgi:hypothetical protein
MRTLPPMLGSQAFALSWFSRPQSVNLAVEGYP